MWFLCRFIKISGLYFHTGSAKIKVNIVKKGYVIMRAYERLLKYVVVRTPSDENSESVPSSSCQFDLAHLLVQELKDLGVSDARVDEQCYVYAHIPATPGYEDRTKIGFIAHMDTVSDFLSLIHI